MIPHDYITEWLKEEPWVENSQVEQVLVIRRPRPYSQDIDLVQMTAEVFICADFRSLVEGTGHIRAEFEPLILFAVFHLKSHKPALLLSATDM
jgi:hypothetical protein